MKAQCSPEPYRETSDGRLISSGLYHEMIANRNKIDENIIDKLIELNVLPSVEEYSKVRNIDITNVDNKVIKAIKSRILTAYLYAEADARTPYGATGYPVYESGELKLDNVLAALSTDETYNKDTRETFKSLAEKLGYNIENVFNPTIINTANFDEMDYAYMARVLTSCYLNLKRLSPKDRLERFGTQYNEVSRNGFKSLVIAEFEKELNDILNSPTIIRTRFQDIFTNNVLNNLKLPNSEIFNYFLDYINKNYGINRKAAYKNNNLNIDESTEENQRDSIEDIDVMWDELQKERIDRKNTLSSAVKAQIALLVGSNTFNRRTTNKAYIPSPVDINILWNQLIEAHLYDVTPIDYYNRLKQLTSTNYDFSPILARFERVFENNGVDASEQDLSFVNAYISGIGLAVIPVNIMALESGNNAKIYQQNRESFGVKTYIDRFESVIDTNIEFGLYDNLESILFLDNKKTKIFESISKTKKLNTENNLNRQMEIINNLGLAVTRDALIQYYNDNGDTNENHAYVNNLISKIALDVLRRKNAYDGKTIPANNVNGFMQSLAKIATYDFNSFTNMSYLDVQGKLNYSPQFDSMLTKFLRGFVTRTGVNKQYIKEVFKDYLNDPTLIAPGAEDNILIYDEKTGLGIFTKTETGEWDIHPSFIDDVDKKRQFALSAFNGVKIGNKGLKYRDVQGALYTYTEIILNMLNQYVFLTSDSPRSYMMTTKRIEIDDLYIKDPNKSRVSINLKTYGSNYNRSIVESSKNAVFIFSGNTKARMLEKPDATGQGSIRGLENTIEIDGFKGYELIKDKATNFEYFTDDDYELYVKDFEKRVIPFINDAINRGKNIYLPMNGISSALASHAPKINSYVNDYLDNLKKRNEFIRITNNEINEDSAIFHAIEKIVNSDVYKFNTYGKIIFQYRDNSPENIEKMKVYHDRKYWFKGKIYDNAGIPTGKSFKFLNISYIQNGKNITLPEHIALLNNVEVSEVYKNMIAQVRNEEFDANLVATPANIKDFVASYIRWNGTTVVDSFKNIIRSLYETNLNVNDESVTIFDTYIADLVQEVYNQKASDWLAKANKRLQENQKPYTLDTIPSLRKESLLIESRNHVLNNYDIIDNDGVRLSILKTLLNHTVYNHSINAIFNGDIEEYKDTVDLNKRVAQVIKNGLNSINSINNNTPRKIVVIEDMNFSSNILDKMNIENEKILNAYKKAATINDSQSIMTDKALVKLLKATGRWNESEPLYHYITDLQDTNKDFDPTAYSKIVEQVKLFGTARRRRGDFYKGITESEIFDNEVDSVQIKDSTVVLFESLTRGTAMGDLYDWMIKNNVDQISPISAVKVSGITPVRIHNDNAGLDLDALNKVTDRSILYMQDNDFVIQQDIKADLLDEVTVLGSQLIKQIMEGLDWNNRIYKIGDNTLTGEELFKEFQTTLATNIREDAMQLLYEIGGIDSSGEIRTDAKGNIQIDINKLTKRFQEIIADDVDAITIRKALELSNDGLPRMPLSYPVIKGKLEKILASMLSKQVINKYLPGFHAPIRADIFTANNQLISHKKFYGNKETYDAVIDEFINNGSITYASDFIERCKREKRSLELQAEHVDSDGKFIYAEVIVNPWQMDFFKNIGTTKRIKNADGTYRNIISVDIDKIDVEARRMVGIRIPTEGKQSMVVFEIVGFLNSNATQAIFPQSLVTRTGWDFDIDSIYAYARHLNFSEGKYTSIKFDAKFDASEGRIGGDFTRSIFRDKYRELAATPQDFTNLTSIEFISICKKIKSKFNINVNPTSETQSFMYGVRQLVEEDLIDIKSNKNYNKTLKYILHNLKYGFNKNYASVLSLVEEYLRNNKSGIPSNTDNYSQEQYKYNIDLLIRARNAINGLLSFIDNVNSQLSDIDIDPNTISNFDVIKSKFSQLKEYCDNVIKGTLSNIEQNIDRAFSQFTKDYPKTHTIYELNSREARDNYLLDIITSVLSNQTHAEEVNKPNAMDEIQAVSDRDNALWNYTLSTLNPNNLMNKITLNNMSMGSTTLKGHSVNFDTLIATISTLHGRLENGIRHIIDLEDLVLPKSFNDRTELYTISKNGNVKLTNKYKEFLTQRYGKDNFQLLSKRKALWVNDVWINNDSLNEHLDISGERIELQMNQFTSGILDVLKAGLGFNLNTHTLSVARAISSGVTIENYNGKANRFSHEDAFIHQPAIVSAVERLEVESLSNSAYTLNDAIESVKSEYIVELSKIYAEYINKNRISPIENHKILMGIANGNNKAKLTISILNELKDVLPDITINEISGKFGYQTTRELLNNIKNRNTHTADWLFRQISVLNNFTEYNEISTSLVDLNFMLKSESRVDSFFKADQKERKLAEYYYPVSSLKNIVNDKYNQTLKFIEEYKSNNNINSIDTDFETLSSLEFRKKYNPIDIKGNPLAAITYTDLKLFKETLPKSNSIISRKELIESLNVGYKTPNKVILDNGKDIIESIFVGSFEGYLNGSRFNNTESNSAYGTIQARYQYAHWLMANGFGDVFITRHPNISNTILGQILLRRNSIDESTYKYVTDSIINYLVSVNGAMQNPQYVTAPILSPINTKEVLTILGVASDDVKKEQKRIFKALIGTIKNGYTIDSFKDYTKLSLAQQIEFIKKDPTLKDYIEKAPEFKNDNIFKYLTVRKVRRNTPYDIIKIQKDDNDINSWSNITDSILRMWDSNIPYIAHTIRQLLIYTYVTEGFNYAYNISKYIPIELITTSRPNNSYDTLCKKINYIDPAVNLGNYGDNLKNAEKAVFDGSVDITPVMNLISRMKSDINVRMLSNKQKAYRWEADKSKATIGYVLDENGQNVAIGTYTDESGNTHEYYLETEARLINSEYASSEYVTLPGKYKDSKVYKRYLIPTNSRSPFTKVYAFLRVNPILKNEISLMTDDISIIPEYQQGMMAQIETESGTQIIDRVSYIASSNELTNFLNAIKYQLDKSATDNTSNSETNSVDTEDDNTSISDVSENEIYDNDVASMSEDSTDVFNSTDVSLIPDSTIKHIYSPADKIIKDEINKAQTSIYITTESNKNFHKGFHNNCIMVDFNKSPYAEAIRIAPLLKAGIFYINGDTLSDSNKNQNYLNDWTKTFISNIYNISPSITELRTIINDGVGQSVAKTFIDVPRTNINIYGDKERLYSRIVKADNPLKDNLRNAFVVNSNIGIELMKTMNRIQKFLNTNNVGNRDEFTAIIKSFDEENFEGGIINALEQRDIDAIKATYKRLVNLANSVYDAIKQLWSITSAVDYANIRSNYGAALDYKDRLNIILKLGSTFNKYLTLEEIKIEDTIYNDNSEESQKLFSDEFGELNNNISRLKSLASQATQINGKAIQAVKDMITWSIIDKSRNPKFVTEFSKIRDYLVEHNYTLEGFNKDDVEITEDEWLNIQNYLFTLDKDISKTQLWLDSAFTTGVSLIDITGKAWDEANYKSKKSIQRINDELEKALDEFKPGLSKNAKAREALMHKFINEYGDLISSYKIDGLGESINTLKQDIKDAIYSNLYTDAGFVTRATTEKTLQIIDDLINSYNEKHSWNIIPLELSESGKHIAELSELSKKEKLVYLQTHNLIELDLVTDIAGKRESVLYKIDFTNTPKSEAYASLTNNERKLLDTIRSLIQQTIKEYDGNWIYYHGNWDQVMPYIPQATLSETAKKYASLPMVRSDKYYIDIDGTKRFISEAQTLKIPRNIPAFTIRRKYNSESYEEYENNIVTIFNEWFKKNNKLNGAQPAKSLKDIRHYNDAVVLENKKYKARTMSYDIIDVMRGFTQELYNLKAINNFESDYQLVQYLFRQPINGIQSARDIIQNAAKQLDNMESRIHNSSKTNDLLDVAAGALLRYTSMTFMYLNYTAGITNVLKGVTDMIIESTANNFVESKDILKSGLNDVIKTIPKFLRDINQTRTDDLLVAIIKDFDDIYQDTRDVRSSDTGTTFWIKALRMADTVGYAPNNIGEFIMQFGMLLAATESHRVVGGKIMSFVDFYNDNLEKLLKEILTNEQYDKYLIFKEDFDAEILRMERKEKKEYYWNHDYASQFIKTNYSLFTDEQRKKIVESRKTDKKVQREAFEKFNTLRSELKLEDGRLSFNTDSGLTEESLSEFRSRVKAINQSLHGIYNRVDRNSLQDSAIGDLLMQFRKWIRPNFVRYFGRRFAHVFYNEQLGAYEIPVFNPVFDMIRSGQNAFKQSLKDNNNAVDYLKAISNFFKGMLSWIRNISFYYNTLPLNEQIATMKFCRLMGALAFSAIAVIGLGALKGDDDNDDNIAYQHLMYTAVTYYQQIVEPMPVYGWMSTISQTANSLFAGQKTVESAGNLITLLTQSLFVDNDEFIYDRGIYKGQDKRAVAVRKMVPVLRQINKFNNLGATMSYYNMYNPFNVTFKAAREALGRKDEDTTEE